MGDLTLGAGGSLLSRIIFYLVWDIWRIRKTMSASGPESPLNTVITS